MGDYPFAQVEVFAVDRPAGFDGGVLGIGFAIGGLADGGPARNPLLHLTYQGAGLSQGYIVSSQAIEAGLTSLNTVDFAFIGLNWNASKKDWMQPVGSLGLPGGFSVDLSVLMDTGIDQMLLWLHVNERPAALVNYSQLPNNIDVSIAVPPADRVIEPALQYTFITGDTASLWRPFWSNGATAAASTRDGTFWRAPTIFMTRLGAASGSAVLQSSPARATPKKITLKPAVAAASPPDTLGRFNL
jgi:hypothetical protein